MDFVQSCKFSWFLIHACIKFHIYISQEFSPLYLKKPNVIHSSIETDWTEIYKIQFSPVYWSVKTFSSTDAVMYINNNLVSLITLYDQFINLLKESTFFDVHVGYEGNNITEKPT